MVKEYVRVNGQKIGMLYAEQSCGNLVVEYCFCDYRYDNVDQEFVKYLHLYNGDINKIPYKHRKQFINFLDRCKRYFKDTVKYPSYFTVNKELGEELTQKLVTKKYSCNTKINEDEIYDAILSIQHDFYLCKSDSTYSKHSCELLFTKLLSCEIVKGDIVVLKGVEYAVSKVTAVHMIDTNQVINRVDLRTK